MKVGTRPFFLSYIPSKGTRTRELLIIIKTNFGNLGKKLLTFQVQTVYSFSSRVYELRKKKMRQDVANNESDLKIRACLRAC